MFAMLGDVRFELLSSFTDFEDTRTAAYAKHEVLAGRPRLQAMGNELTEIRFSLRLHWKLGNPDTAYRGLIEAKEAQEALALVYGSGRHAGWFVISSISSRTLIQDAKGRTAARELAVSAWAWGAVIIGWRITAVMRAGGVRPERSWVWARARVCQSASRSSCISASRTA